MESDEIKLVPEPKESIKLERNSKGYNFEIKIYPKVLNMLLPTDLDRLEELNKTMLEKFG